MSSVNSVERKLTHGETVISYRLTRRRRKTLGIRVTRTGEVLVAAPLGVTLTEIEAVLLRKAPWILRKLREVERLPKRSHQRHISGERWRYLGEHLLLRVEVQPEQPEGVRLDTGELIVKVRAAERAERVLQAWWKGQAHAVFSARLAALADHAAGFGLHHSGEFRTRHMRTRWGSMSSQGRLNLNTALLHTPIECIDYVLLHELCHLREFNHSPRYYALLDQVLPDWRERRQRLNEENGWL